jgi:hypothetical protein
MVLKVGSDWKIDDHRNTESGQLIGWADAGQHEDLRRAVCAGREDDLPFLNVRTFS